MIEEIYLLSLVLLLLLVLPLPNLLYYYYFIKRYRPQSHNLYIVCQGEQIIYIAVFLKIKIMILKDLLILQVTLDFKTFIII